MASRATCSRVVSSAGSSSSATRSLICASDLLFSSSGASRTPNFSLASHSYTPPATLEEVRRLHPLAREIEPEGGVA